MEDRIIASVLLNIYKNPAFFKESFCFPYSNTDLLNLFANTEKKPPLFIII